jgi:AcrR family transcriptional regulator
LAEDPPATGRQRQAAETRQHLLDVACEVFEERGYLSTSVGAITERAATAHGTFYLYFKNKEDVFCQVMETVIVNELAASSSLPEGIEPRDGVERVIRGFVTAYRPRVGLWRAVLEGMLGSTRIRELWLDLRRSLVHGIAAVLEEECRRGLTRPMDPHMTAYAIAAMTEWFSFMHFGLQEPAPVPTEPGGEGEVAIGVLVDLWYQAMYGQVPV